MFVTELLCVPGWRNIVKVRLDDLLVAVQGQDLRKKNLRD